MCMHTCHVCRSVVFTTKKAHACTKTPPPPLDCLPGQQERKLPRGMLRMKEERSRRKKREKESEKKERRRHKRQPNLPRLILI